MNARIDLAFIFAEGGVTSSSNGGTEVPLNGGTKVPPYASTASLVGRDFSPADERGREGSRNEVRHRPVYGSNALQAVRTASIMQRNRGSVRRLARNGS